MLTTAYTACISVINYSCGVSKKTVFFFFFKHKAGFLGWKQLSLHSKEQRPLPSTQFGLNSIAYPHSSVSNPNASPVKKTLGLGKTNMCKFVIENVISCFKKYEINKALCLSVNLGCYHSRKKACFYHTLVEHTLIKSKIWL